MYGDLKENFGDLNEDDNLVKFFLAVLERRDNLEEEERLCQETQGVIDTLGAGLPWGYLGYGHAGWRIPIFWLSNFLI